ncbi:hypothetical protein ACS0TY_012694 [Phlomoides rotata]
MATRFPVCSAPVITLNRASTRGTTSSGFVVMCSKNHISVDLTCRSSHKNKVFEDRSAGIVCYRDENGEITCEGYDEGPRFHQKKLPTFNQRDVEIIQLLQKCWLQVGGES